MKLRFQADADLNPLVGRILASREASIDWRPAKDILPDGMSDPEVLRISAAAGRVLVTYDARTLRRHFEKFILTSKSPGILQAPQEMRLVDLVDGLLCVWREHDAEALRNQIWWIPRPR